MTEKPDRQEFLWNVHGHQCSFIQFADAKAGAVIAWNGAQLAYVLSDGTIERMKATFAMGEGLIWNLCLPSAALLALGIAIIVAFSVLIPNLARRAARKQIKTGGRPESSELIFWETIAATSPDDYRQRVIAAANVDDQVAWHINELACVAKLKYARLKAAFVTSLVATALVVASTIGGKS